MELESPSQVANAAPALSVSELTFKIKNQLEQSYPGVCVQGEVSNYKRHSSGHLYFTLKDESAQLSVVLFQPQASRLNFEPKDGDKVIVRGQITVYSQRGAYQLVARSMEKVGLGELLLKLEALKKELKALGWFNPESKKKLPPVPSRIGVITSPTGAVIRDIINVLSHRHPGFHLTLYPVRVQGSTAASEIAAAIDYFNKHQLCDVLIVARGGGSFEDLMPFNERPLLDAVHQSLIPIISAVGHETDFTLCDFVADLRAPTPSAAAERVLPSKREWKDKVSLIAQGIERRLQSQIDHHRQHLRALEKHQLLAEPLQLLYARTQFLDDVEEHLHRQIQHQIEHLGLRLHHFGQRLSLNGLIKLHQQQYQRLETVQSQLLQRFNHTFSRQEMRLKLIQPNLKEQLIRLFQKRSQQLELTKGLLTPARLDQLLILARGKLNSLWQVLEALSPEAAMKRGYAILKSADNKPIPLLLQKGETLRIETRSQHLIARIEEASTKIECVEGQYQLFD